MAFSKRAVEPDPYKSAPSWYDIIMANKTFNVTNNRTISRDEALLTLRMILICDMFNDFVSDTVESLVDSDKHDAVFDQLCKGSSGHDGFLSLLCLGHNTDMDVDERYFEFCSFGGRLLDDNDLGRIVQSNISPKWDAKFSDVSTSVSKSVREVVDVILDDLPSPRSLAGSAMNGSH